MYWQTNRSCNWPYISRKKIISIGKEAFIDCKSIVSLTLSENIRTIRYGAFEGCTSLEYVDFANGLEKIEWRAFHGCSSLSMVEFPDSVIEICESSFTDCISITSIYLGSSLKNLDFYAFEGCVSLERINVSPSNSVYASCDGILMDKSMTAIIFCPYGRGGALFIPEGVEKIKSRAFAFCKKIICLYLPNSLEVIGENAFEGCTNLSEITIPGYLKLSVGSPFDSCSKISEIHFHQNSPCVNAECLKSFLRCYSLKKVYIPFGVVSIDMFGLIQCSSFEEFVVDEKNEVFSTIDGMLCSKDKKRLFFCPRKKEGKLVIPDGIQILEKNSIHNCYRIQNIFIPKSVVEIKTDCFCKSKGIREIIVDSNNTNYCSQNGLLLTKNKTKLIYWPADNDTTRLEVPTNIEVIGKNAFTECSNVTSIVIPPSVKEIEHFAFLSYSKLDTIFFKGKMTEFNDINMHGGWFYESVRRVCCRDGILPKRALKKMFTSKIDLSKYAN